MNNYLLSYNTFALNPTENQLLNHVQVNRFIAQYYQPFVGTYIIKSEQPIGTLSESLKGFFNNSPYLLTQLFPNLAGGSLPSDIWHWINHGYIPRPPSPASPSNMLTSLLGDSSQTSKPPGN